MPILDYRNMPFWKVPEWKLPDVPAPKPWEQIDTSVPTMQLPHVTNPLEMLGATSSATGRAIGSLMDKPGNLRDAIYEGLKGLRSPITGDRPTSPTEELERRTGVEAPTIAKLGIDSLLDIGNVADPMKMFLPVAGMASHSDDAIRALAKKGLESLKKGKGVVKAAEEVLPKVETILPKVESQAHLFGEEAPKVFKGQGDLFGGGSDVVEEELARQGDLFKDLPPEIQDAGVKANQTIRDRITKGSLSRFLADVGKSNMSVIKDSGRTGPQLAQLLTKTRLDADRLGAVWRLEAEEATKGLSPEQIAEYVHVRDTGAIPTNKAVADAVMKRRALEEKIAQHVKATGTELKVGGRPIETGGEWPRIYSDEFFRDKDNAIRVLMEQGLTPQEAEKAFERSHNLNQRLVNPTTGEQIDIPGYRTDLPADYMHLTDAAKRVVNARNFGMKDIGDPASPLSKLIQGTDDPKRIRELVRRHLGQEAPATSMKATNAVVRGAIKAQTALHLSQFALSNISQAASVPFRANMGEFAKALGKTITNFKGAAGEAAATGALQTIEQDLLREVGGESRISKLYGMKKSETFNRTIAAISGKGTAESLFNQLKAGKGSASSLRRAQARLENLVLEPAGTLLKQESLTEDQLARAGGRMSEITQGRAQNIDLPKLWSDHPVMDMILLFKKYAFRQTRIITDAIKENPTRNIPLLLAAYTATGELVGDSKAAIKGLTSGKGPAQEIQDRGKGVERLAANLGQSWAFGLLAEALGAAHGGPTDILQFGAGPIVGDTAKLVGNVGSGNVRGIEKQALGAVPFFGPGLAQNENLLTDKKSGGRKGGLPSLPRVSGPRLPRLPRP